MSNSQWVNKIAQRAYFDELAKLAWNNPGVFVRPPAAFKDLAEAVQIKAEKNMPQLKPSNALQKTTRPLPSTVGL